MNIPRLPRLGPGIMNTPELPRLGTLYYEYPWITSSRDTVL